MSALTNAKKKEVVELSLKACVAYTLVFFIIQLVGIFHHEPWMDEFQAFQIAMNSHSLSNLFYNMRYEGHPAAWHLLLYAITRFTDNIFAMQVAHIIIASAGIFLLFRYSPFTLLEKVLISLGYFMFYEYAQISRSYVITVFSVIAICAFLNEKYYKRKSLNETVFTPSFFLYFALLIFLLANSSVYSFVISGVFFVYMVLVVWRDKTRIISKPKLKAALVGGMFIMLVGWICALIEIIPRSDNGFSSFVPVGFDLSRTGIVITQLLLAYFPMPALGRIQCWCTYFILPDPNKTLIIPALLCFFAVVIIFSKKPAILFFYCISTFGISVLLLYVHNLSLHYFGHHFIILLICFWLDRCTSPNPGILIIISDAFIAGLKKVLFLSILIIQAIAGIYMYSMDIKEPFANCSAAGTYIVKNHLDRFPLIGGMDFYILPLAYYTHKPIYTFDRDDTSRFTVWDKKRNSNITPGEFFGRLINQVDKSKNDTCLLCLYVQPYLARDGKMVPISEEGQVEDFDPLHQIKAMQLITQPTMIANNNYYIYLIWKKSAR